MTVVASALEHGTEPDPQLAQMFQLALVEERGDRAIGPIEVPIKVIVSEIPPAIAELAAETGPEPPTYWCEVCDSNHQLGEKCPVVLRDVRDGDRDEQSSPEPEAERQEGDGGKPSKSGAWTPERRAAQSLRIKQAIADRALHKVDCSATPPKTNTSSKSGSVKPWNLRVNPAEAMHVVRKAVARVPISAISHELDIPIPEVARIVAVAGIAINKIRQMPFDEQEKAYAILLDRWNARLAFGRVLA